MAPKIRIGPRRLSASIVGLLILGQEAIAGSLSYEVDAGLGESDNINLASTDKVSQTIATAGLIFNYQQQTRVLEASANGNFNLYDYLQHAYGTELIGRFDGQARLALVPERLTWLLQENFGSATLDPFIPQTPINRENVSYLTTGPEISLSMGSTDSLHLNLLYSRAQYETSPFNSNRLTGTLALEHDISSTTNVSLYGNAERVLFENTFVNTDFDRDSVYLRYTLHGMSTDLAANVGVTEISEAGESNAGPLASLVLTRRPSPAAKLTLEVGRELTDASSSFSQLGNGPITALVAAPAPLTSTNYTSLYGSAAWRYERSRTILSVSARWEKDAYEGIALDDVIRKSAEFEVGRRLTRALSIQLSGTLFDNDYSHANYSSADWLIGGALTYYVGRRLELRLRYDHAARTVSGVGVGYGENRAFLTLVYAAK